MLSFPDEMLVSVPPESVGLTDISENDCVILAWTIPTSGLKLSFDLRVCDILKRRICLAL